MAERKAQQKYIPPDFNPKIHGTINRYQHSHPLRSRAKRLGEGIVVIRFEMPFNIWCDQCGAMIAKGVRFNAEKKCVGSYFSTEIFRFRMKCANCPDTVNAPNYIEIETDPEHCDYKVVSGGRKKEETRIENEVESGSILLYDEETRKKMHEDPFYRLENVAADKERGNEAKKYIDDLLSNSLAPHEVALVNRKIRDQLREKRNESKKLKHKRKEMGFYVPLLPISEEDEQQAKAIVQAKPFRPRVTADENQKLKLQEMQSKPLFEPPKAKPTMKTTKDLFHRTSKQTQLKEAKALNTAKKLNLNLVKLQMRAQNGPKPL